MSLSNANALERIDAAVTNTKERAERAHAFDYSAAHSVYPLDNRTVAEGCGFDPAKLLN